MAGFGISGTTLGQQNGVVESVAVTSAPSGGSAGEPVWIIGDPVVVEVRYSVALPSTARATLRIELDERGDGHGATREADCRPGGENSPALACTYVVQEGDEGTGISVEARTGVLRGTGLPASVFDAAQVAPSAYPIDGTRLSLAQYGVRVQLLDADGFFASRNGATVGDTVEVSLAFADGEQPAHSPGFGVSLVFENARRPMTHVADSDGTLDFRYVVVAGDNARRFRLELDGEDRLTDRNGNAGLAAGDDVNEHFLPGSTRRVDTQGPRIVDVRIEEWPATGAYVDSDTRDANPNPNLDLDSELNFVVEFDEAVVGHGAVSLEVLVGSGADESSQAATCVAASAPELHCTLAIMDGWEDADGVRTPADPLAFGADDLADDLGNAAVNRHRASRFPDHRIDTTPPEIERIKVTAPPTPRTGDYIVVEVTFSEDIRMDAQPTLRIGGVGDMGMPVFVSGSMLRFRHRLTGDLSGGVEPDRVVVGSFTVSDAHGNTSNCPEQCGAIDVDVADTSTRSSGFRGVERVVLNNAPPEGRDGVRRFADGDMVDLRVVFGEAVYVSGPVKLAVGSGEASCTVQATLPQVQVMTCTYQPVEADHGKRIAVTKLELAERAYIVNEECQGYKNAVDTISGGPTACASKDQAKQAGTVSLGNTRQWWPSPLPMVDLVAPTVNEVTLLPTPAPQATAPGEAQKYYGRDETIRIQVAMSEDVVADTQPTLEVTLSGEKKGATFAGFATGNLEYKHGYGRNLVYEYVVEEGDDDGDGIDVTLTWAENTLADLAGNVWAGTTEQTWSKWSPRHRVDGSLDARDEREPNPPGAEDEQSVHALAVDAVRGVRVAGRPESGYYRAGDEIVIEVHFDPWVTFAAPPQLLMDFDVGGDACRRVDANLASGADVATLAFRCAVAAGDEDRDGIEASLSGRLTTADGQTVRTGPLRLASPPRVDAVAPVVTAVAVTTDGPYTRGDDIVVRVSFSEAVAAAPGAVLSLPIELGGQTRRAPLTSPSSGTGDTFVFTYTVAEGDNDADGISVPALASASLGGGLADAAGNAAAVEHAGVAPAADQLVDTAAPKIECICIAGSAGTRGAGEEVVFEARFSETVVLGTAPPTLTVLIGTDRRSLSPTDASPGDRVDVLTFAYVVNVGDTGAIAVPANALTGEFADLVGIVADTGHPATAFDGYDVDAAPAMIAEISVVSEPRDGVYVVGGTIVLALRFDEAVVVTPSGTGPTLLLAVGEQQRVARHRGGSGTDTLLFEYVVERGDSDEDGVAVPANALRLPHRAAIADAVGLPASVSHPPLPAQSGHRVDGVVPVIEDVQITSRPAADAYAAGESIEVTVVFAEPVAVGGTTELALHVGTGTRVAECSTAPSNSLRCRYVVADGDWDANGIGIAADSLAGTVTDLPGNAADLTHRALADDAAHRVFAAVPELTAGIEDLHLVAGGQMATVELGPVFGGFDLVYRASTSDAAVAVAEAEGTSLVLRSGAEGAAVVTVAAGNAAGSVTTTFVVEVTTDHVEAAVLNDTLAAIGRSLLSGAATVIGARFELTPARARSGAVTVGGRQLTPAALSEEMDRRLLQRDRWAPDVGRGEERYRGQTWPAPPALLGSSGFSIPLQAFGTTLAVAVWGAGDLARFEGSPDGGAYDGSHAAGYLGVDVHGAGWLAGASVSRSAADADYEFNGAVRGTGALSTSLSGFHPYAKINVGDATRVWVVAGLGSGEAELGRSHVGNGVDVADLSMAMAVAGVKRNLNLEFRGANLSMVGDAGFLTLETDDGTRAVEGLSATVSRGRVALEAAWDDLGGVRPFAELGGRLDGGDGQTGGGIDVAGGVRVDRTASGFGLEAKGRVLVVHSADGYSASGFSVTASFEPGKAGRGVTFRVSPRWGGPVDGMDPFRDGMGSRPYANDPFGLGPEGWGLDAAVGYGLNAPGPGGLLTPFGEVDSDGARNRVRVGVRYGLAGRFLQSARIELSLERATGGHDGPHEGRALLNAQARF